MVNKGDRLIGEGRIGSMAYVLDYKLYSLLYR